MSPRNVFDVNDIEPGVYISRHLACQESEHNLTGGSRLYVKWADRSRWVNNDDILALTGSFESFLFSKVLGLFVVAYEFLGGGLQLLVTDRACRRDAKGRNRAGVDNAPDSGGCGGIENIDCSMDVDVIESFGIGSPQAI